MKPKLPLDGHDLINARRENHTEIYAFCIDTLRPYHGRPKYCLLTYDSLGGKMKMSKLTSLERGAEHSSQEKWIEMLKCQECNHDTNVDGYGGKCKHCGAVYCKTCWNRKTWCTVCQNKL